MSEKYKSLKIIPVSKTQFLTECEDEIQLKESMQQQNSINIRNNIASTLNKRFNNNIKDIYIQEVSNLASKCVISIGIDNIDDTNEIIINMINTGIEHTNIFSETCYIPDIGKKIIELNEIPATIKEKIYSFIQEINQIKADTKNNRNTGCGEFVQYTFFNVESSNGIGDFKNLKEWIYELKCEKGGLTHNNQIPFVKVCDILTQGFKKSFKKEKIKVNVGIKGKIFVLCIDNKEEFPLNGVDNYIKGFGTLFIRYKDKALQPYITALYKQYKYTTNNYNDNIKLDKTDLNNIKKITNALINDIPEKIEKLEDYYAVHNILAKIQITCYLINTEIHFLLFTDKDKLSILCIKNSKDVEKIIDDITKHQNKIRIDSVPSPNSSAQSNYTFLWRLEEYECANKGTGTTKMVLVDENNNILVDENNKPIDKTVGYLNQEKYRKLGYIPSTEQKKIERQKNKQIKEAEKQRKKLKKK